MADRRYAADPDLEDWMRQRGVTEADVVAWAKADSLWSKVAKKLSRLLSRKDSK